MEAIVCINNTFLFKSMIPIYYITESTLKSVWSEDRESYYIQEIIHGSTVCIQY
jgi:hypothetical protein